MVYTKVDTESMEVCFGVGEVFALRIGFKDAATVACQDVRDGVRARRGNKGCKVTNGALQDLGGVRMEEQDALQCLLLSGAEGVDDCLAGRYHPFPASGAADATTPYVGSGNSVLIHHGVAITLGCAVNLRTVMRPPPRSGKRVG